MFPSQSSENLGSGVAFNQDVVLFAKLVQKMYFQRFGCDSHMYVTKPLLSLHELNDGLNTVLDHCVPYITLEEKEGII